MRLQVNLSSECLAITISEDDVIKAIGDKALRKLHKLRPRLFGALTPQEFSEWVREIRKIPGGSLMDPEDVVGEMLRDGEFVTVDLIRDLPGRRRASQADLGHCLVEKMRPKVVHTPKDSLFYTYSRPEHFVKPTDILTLTGETLTTEDLVNCGRGLYQIELSPDARDRVHQARRMLEKVVSENRVVYGVTTGFGNFANVVIPREKLMELQNNLIRSHACGVGDPLPPSRARMVLALRINVLAKGYAGVSIETVDTMVAAFNEFCVSWVPEKGTVGCSGDLAPLAHLALGLMGEGQMWSPETGWQEASKVLALHCIRPLSLGPKEGIALINGTQMVTALGAEAIVRSSNIAYQADVIAALTLDVLKGTTMAFDADIHKLRPHPGQIATAARLRALLHSDRNPSEIAESHRFCGKVQDAYTLRCVPQVHGVTHDVVEFCQKILTTELNSATDNPLVFVDRGEIISGGNFHGEYPAKVLDMLAIAVHELAQMSERRLERLMNKNYSDLPDFLTREGGLNSGLMIVQVVAASLVSENKVLCHPSSVDSIPTSGNQEDHVSMGGFAARKALKVVENVELVLAMEMLAACQGVDLLGLRTTAPLQKVYDLVRQVSAEIETDRFLAPEIEAATRLLRDGNVWDCVRPYLDETRRLETDDPDLLISEAPSPTSSQLTDIAEPPTKKAKEDLT